MYLILCTVEAVPTATFTLHKLLGLSHITW
jgi:hypothetical protein